MIPFCRSTKEADRVLAVMAENGLKRGENGLEVYVMCEIPSNVILAKAFAERFDGFSIGSNDLTQLTLGVDRDSGELAELFDEQDEAVKWMIESVIREAHKAGAKVGLCGQAPSDHPEFAEFLVACGIDSMSVSPDSFIAVKPAISTPSLSRRRSRLSAPAISPDRWARSLLAISSTPALPGRSCRSIRTRCRSVRRSTTEASPNCRRHPILP